MAEANKLKMHRYGDREDLAEALASGVAAVLAGAIAARGAASLVVSGGSTPKRFLERLSQCRIDWPNVTVTLVDERWVPESDERSNGAFLRRHLLRNEAAKAHFVPIYLDAPKPQDVEDDLDARFHRLARPFDAVILGMGADGHTASFFPGSGELFQAIDPQTRRSVVAIEAPGAVEPRATLTLPMLTDAHFLALHIEGEEKRRAFEAACGDGPVEDMPVRAVLRCEREEAIAVFWAP